MHKHVYLIIKEKVGVKIAMQTSVYLYLVQNTQYMTQALQRDYCFTKSNITAANVYPESTLISPQSKYSTRSAPFLVLFGFL